MNNQLPRPTPAILYSLSGILKRALAFQLIPIRLHIGGRRRSANHQLRVLSQKLGYFNQTAYGVGGLGRHFVDQTRINQARNGRSYARGRQLRLRRPIHARTRAAISIPVAHELEQALQTNLSVVVVRVGVRGQIGGHEPLDVGREEQIVVALAQIHRNLE